MKYKNGFTIIEVVLTLAILILVIGTTNSIIIINNNKNKTKMLTSINKKIQEAAGVYISINKDLKKSIENNIYNGGSGYVIQLKFLIDDGYIDATYIKTLQENGVNVDINNDYMLAALFANDQQQCNDGDSIITINASYQLETNKPYYLCDFTTERKFIYYDLGGGYFDTNVERLYKGNKGHYHDIISNMPIKNDDDYSYVFNGWFDQDNCQGNHLIGSIEFNDQVIYACYKKEKKYYFKYY